MSILYFRPITSVSGVTEPPETSLTAQILYNLKIKYKSFKFRNPLVFQQHPRLMEQPPCFPILIGGHLIIHQRSAVESSNPLIHIKSSVGLPRLVVGLCNVIFLRDIFS